MRKIALLALFASLCFCFEITDMAGNKIKLQEPPSRVYSPKPYGSYMLYVMDRKLLVSLVFAPSEEARDFLDPIMYELPALGLMSENGPITDAEALLAQKPDLILMWDASANAKRGAIDDAIVKANIPVAYVVAKNLEDYPKVFRFLGKALDRKERGEKLAARFEKTIAGVKAAVAKAKTKPKVYYAGGFDGLTSECHDSNHAEPLKILGDLNVLRCNASTKGGHGHESVTIEQIRRLNPDVIIVQEKMFADDVFNDPQWETIAAVKNKKVYLIPSLPFNWFNHPPSFMRVMGLQWLANVLYPKEYPIDIAAETKAFYAEYLGVELNDELLARVLTPQSLRSAK
ncbi:MAG: ABC transporter substrate-binding protein [Helicobacteraceae bacterium]|jgi:iron complex transport system substrate-binding protein|nr:ABC transporter substrate-binding protein [Helicobacteraceae bacterium]